MAKKKPTNAIDKEGPFLACAFFCERVIDDKDDGVPSIIRIIDTLTLHIAGESSEIPSEENRILVPLNGYLGFRSGNSPGKHKLRIEPEGPSGKKREAVEKDIVLAQEPHGGFNLKLNINLNISEAGVHWIHVLLDGKHFTSMPFRVVIDRTPDVPDDK